ncbi:MAG: L-threonylcarbamoyladenylate synthase [Wenzhouxiangellaceae bacterium]|nr:L-threonylcarbamoyladenylate synthase [Wenzhouxiangellaceae bacterium]
MRRLTPDAAGLDEAARLLAAGELVAFPTETVYGLGADAANPEAIAKVFLAKGRPSDHPLIVHLPDEQALSAWVEQVPENARRLIAQFWPGPLTLVLPRAATVSDRITGGQDTVAVRVPNHPVARALLRRFGGALVAPSANRFGRISPTRAEHVESEFGDEVAAVIDGGACPVGVESTIVDLSGDKPRILRPGMVRSDAIAAELEQPLCQPGDNEGPRAPGRLASHYAPEVPLEAVAADRLHQRLAELLAAGQRVVVLARFERDRSAADTALSWIRMPRQPVQHARALYAQLRHADALHPDRILVEQVPAGEGWDAVRDRLARACA